MENILKKEETMKIMPVIHGGHSVLDNHSPKHCGLSPERYRKGNFILENCSYCPARRYCYRIQDPRDSYEKVKFLKLIYRCYLEIAREKKINPMGFVVHLPVPAPFRTYLLKRYNVSEFKATNVCMPPEDLDVFITAVKSLSKEFGDQAVWGVEIDFIPKEFRDNQETEDYLAKLPKKIIIIGSVHFISINGQIFRVGRQGNDLINAQNYIKKHSLEDFWVNILQATLQLVTDYKIDILAHPFAFEKHLPFCPVTSETEKLVKKIAEVATEKGIVVELNSSGLTKGIHQQDPYFPAQWVKIFQEYGTRFTIGDDSHNQLQIGQAYQKLEEFMKSCGLTEIYIPSQKSWRPISIQ